MGALILALALLGSPEQPENDLEALWPILTDVESYSQYAALTPRQRARIRRSLRAFRALKSEQRRRLRDTADVLRRMDKDASDRVRLKARNWRRLSREERGDRRVWWREGRDR